MKISWRGLCISVVLQREQGGWLQQKSLNFFAAMMFFYPIKAAYYQPLLQTTSQWVLSCKACDKHNLFKCCKSLQTGKRIEHERRSWRGDNWIKLVSFITRCVWIEDLGVLGFGSVDWKHIENLILSISFFINKTTRRRNVEDDLSRTTNQSMFWKKHLDLFDPSIVTYMLGEHWEVERDSQIIIALTR